MYKVLNIALQAHVHFLRVLHNVFGYAFSPNFAHYFAALSKPATCLPRISSTSILRCSLSQRVEPEPLRGLWVATFGCIFLQLWTILLKESEASSSKLHTNLLLRVVQCRQWTGRVPHPMLHCQLVCPYHKLFLHSPADALRLLVASSEALSAGHYWPATDASNFSRKQESGSPNLFQIVRQGALETLRTGKPRGYFPGNRGSYSGWSYDCSPVRPSAHLSPLKRPSPDTDFTITAV